MVEPTPTPWQSFRDTVMSHTQRLKIIEKQGKAVVRGYVHIGSRVVEVGKIMYTGGAGVIVLGRDPDDLERLVSVVSTVYALQLVFELVPIKPGEPKRKPIGFDYPGDKEDSDTISL